MVNTSKNCLDNINYLVQYSIKIVKTWYKMFKYFRFPIITVVCLSCSLTTIVSNNVVKLEKKKDKYESTLLNEMKIYGKIEGNERKGIPKIYD